MPDGPNEQGFNPEAFPIVSVVWRDHTTTSPQDGPWVELKDALENSGPVLVHEVGFLLKNEESQVVIAACLSEDEGCKGVSTILPECIVSLTPLTDGSIDAD